MRLRHLWALSLLVLFLALLGGHGVTQTRLPAAAVTGVSDSSCGAGVQQSCHQRHALIFVHGLYGSKQTFHNPGTKFSWPIEFSKDVKGMGIDVFELEYRTTLLSWRDQANPKFDDFLKALSDALASIRRREYDSINFIAHSLGGNLVAAYLIQIKSEFSTPGLSQHGFVITLGTPVTGSHLANLGAILKTGTLMSDPLLDVLTKNNAFLLFSKDLRTRLSRRQDSYECRPTLYYAAVEGRNTYGFPVAPAQIAEDDEQREWHRNQHRESQMPFSLETVRVFDVDHLQIAKPENGRSDLYEWVAKIVEAETKRMDIRMRETIHLARQSRTFDKWRERHFCRDIPFKSER